MKDFANIKKSKRKIIKKKSVFTSNRPLNRTISSSTILFLIIVSFSLVVTSMFYFKTDVISFKPESSTNSISIDFPSSLLENSVLIEFNEENSLMNCNYFVQIGAYGNKKYAIEAMNIINDDIKDITINEVYSSLLPGKLLNSVISGPYSNRSSANNAKEKITKMGFDPSLRTVCKES